MDPRMRFGYSGEGLAAALYERDGYEVVERNFSCSEGEIDLIARKGRTLVVCEVKTRRTDYFGDPAEAVTPAKQARLRKLAMVWLARNQVHGMKLRFDVVSIVNDGRGSRVRRLENAF